MTGQRLRVSPVGLLFLLLGAMASLPRGAAAQEELRPPSLRSSLAAGPDRSAAVWIHVDSARWAEGEPVRLSPEARRRRQLLGEPDLPVDRHAPPALLRALEAAGARIREESRWLRAVSADVDSAALETVVGVPGIRAITRVAASRRIPVPPPPGPPPDATAIPDTAYGGLLEALVPLGIPLLHEMGFTGEGVRVGILDTGFRTDHRAFRETEVVAKRDFIQGDSVVRDEGGDPEGAHDHGTSVWSIVGGADPGRILGVAFDAGYALAKTEDIASEPRADEDRWVAGLEWLESTGVRVVNSSLGYRTFDDFAYAFEDLDGDVTASARAADEAVRRGVLVVNAVGNGGPELRTLVSPADGDSVLAVGAASGGGAPTSFSSRGPTADGRTKPDLLARGTSVTAASGSDTTAYTRVQGTSFSTPLVAGAAVLLAQAYPTLGPAAILRALRTAGDTRSEPTNARGYGIPDVASALFFPEDLVSLPLEELRPDGVVSTLVPTFRWDAPTINPGARPVTFRVEVARDRSFVELVDVDSTTGVFARELERPLRPADSLFWRVVARTAPGVERVAHPVRGPFGVPPWVRLRVLNEPRGVTIPESRPEFRWDAAELPPPAGPLVFDLEVISGRGSGPVQRHEDLTTTTFRLPEPLPVNTPFRWRIVARATGGRADTVTSAGPFVVTSRSRPPVTLLHQNFPNPFPRPDLGRSETRIWLDLATRTRVELAVYDLKGRLVRRLVPAPGCSPQRLDPGLYGREGSPEPGPCVDLTWDGRNDRGERVERGVYLIRLRTADVEEVKRAVFWP